MRTETLFPYLSQVPNPDLDVKSSQERISSRRQQTQELHPYLSFPLKIWELELAYAPHTTAFKSALPVFDSDSTLFTTIWEVWLYWLLY